MALYSGWQQFIHTYRQEDFVAEYEYDWDLYPQRMARYWHNRRYADNTIYTAVNTYLSLFKSKEKLYKNIRGLRNPISRLVQIEAAKVFGGTINYENFKEGAIRIADADDNLLDAIRTIWQWSNLETMKTPLVRSGATMGDTAIKVVDDVERKRTRLEILDPRKVQDVEFDGVGNVKEIVICYLETDRLTGIDNEYKEIITKEKFQIMRGKSAVEEYDNPYGFVPVRWIPHVNIGRNFGETTFHNSRGKIDNLNDLVSMLHMNMRIQASPKFTINKSGMPEQGSSPTTIAMSVDSEDKAPFIPIGDAGEIKPIVYNADLANGLELCLQLQAEIQADLPQLKLENISGKIGNTSGIAIENLYGDAIDIIEELQGTYIAGLKAATQMAISMAAYRGYDAFRAYSLDSYEAGVLDFEIKPKPVFKDKLTTKERLDMTIQAVNSEASSLILPQLEYDEDEIEMVENKQDERARVQMRNAFDGVFPPSQDDSLMA